MTRGYFESTVLFFILIGISIPFGSLVFAHEPIFSLGPETIFKGGIGVEFEGEYFKKSKLLKDGSKVSNPLERERHGFKFNTELLYGVTQDISVTLKIPYLFLERKETSGSERIERTSSFSYSLHLAGGIEVLGRSIGLSGQMAGISFNGVEWDCGVGGSGYPQALPLTGKAIYMSLTSITTVCKSLQRKADF